MPPVKKNSDPVDKSKNLLNAIVAAHKDDLYNDIQTEAVAVSTGSLGLDQQISVYTGSVLRLAGPTSAGKTSQAFLLASNLMQKINKGGTSYVGSKTLFIKAEARLGNEIQGRTGLKFVYQTDDWEDGTVYVLECNVFETVATIIEGFLKQFYADKKQLIVILDSMDGLILRNDLQEKGFGDNQKVAGVPLITKIMFKRLALPINKYGCLFIVTSQVSANIKLDPYSKEAPRVVGGAGGNALNHHSDYILEYQPRYNGDYICENPDEKSSPKNKIIGTWCKIKIIKSAKETDGVTVEIPIRRGRVGNAVWAEKEIVDYLLQNNLIEKKGGWFKISETVRSVLKEKLSLDVPEQIQGLNNVYEFFEVNKNATELLTKLFQG